MIRKHFEAYKSGTYRPRNDYYVETFKPVWIPPYKQFDKDCWFGPGNPHNHKERNIRGQYSNHISLRNGRTYEVEFEGEDIIFTIYPRETILIKKDGKYNYTSKYLEPYTVKVNYRNIKAFR